VVFGVVICYFDVDLMRLIVFLIGVDGDGMVEVKFVFLNCV